MTASFDRSEVYSRVPTPEDSWDPAVRVDWAVQRIQETDAIIEHYGPDHYLGHAALTNRVTLVEAWQYDQALLEAQTKMVIQLDDHRSA